MLLVSSSPKRSLLNSKDRPLGDVVENGDEDALNKGAAVDAEACNKAITAAKLNPEIFMVVVYGSKC